MDLKQALKIVVEVVKEAVEGQLEIDAETELWGGDPVLDSMKIVEICVSLEDAAEDLGFEFDWTSETALSKSKSMFRSVTSLAEEFLVQWEEAE